MKRLILLDSHAILHRAYHALPDFSTAQGEPTGALYGLSTMLIKTIEDLKPDYIVAAYDLAGPTHRHEVFKEYKAGRQKTDDALIRQLNTSRQVFEALNIPIYDKAGFEADDMLGTIVEQLKNAGFMIQDSGSEEKNPVIPAKAGIRGSDEDLEIIIASGDMDTLQLISGTQVKVFTLKKGIKDTIMYDEKAVQERFGFGPELIPDYKGLRGDPSDNIPGIKGVGEKTATILITSFGTLENMYVELEAGHEDAFIKAGITPRIVQLLKDNKDEAMFSKMLATIRRDAPIDFVFPEKTFKENVDLKKVKALWNVLEFRTLGQRLENVLAGKKSSAMSVVTVGSADPRLRGDDKTGGQGDIFSVIPAQAGIRGAESPLVSKEEIEKTGVALWLINSNATNPQLEDILNFANTDDYEVAKKMIFEELDRRNLRTVYETLELPLLPITHRMEERGVKIDKVFLADLSKKYHKELALLEKNITAAAGVEFNINSPKQLGEILFDKLGLVGKNMKKTSGGARSTRESELEKLRDLHPIIPMIFEYRELQKLLSTYIDAIPPQLDSNNRLHSDFIPAGTTTGRMASLDPNLQNIPVKSELGKAIRKAFVAEKGFALVSLDYSQIELRIAAFLSKDQTLIDIFKNGTDVHTSVASSVFKVPLTEVTSDMRRKAKVINFGILYGMGVMALKQNLGTDRAEAQKFMDDYFATFSTLAAYIDQVKADAARTGYTETFFGRRRYFEGINSKIPYIRAQAERMAFNAPIQGTEADVVKLALIKVDSWLKEAGLTDVAFPILQVHDELVYEIREDRAHEIGEKIRSIMESIIDPKDIAGITLTSEMAVGANWGDLK
ncbi:MAG: DNA polymerase [Patescibacteria group bacterium]